MNFDSFNKLMTDATRYLYEVKGVRPRTADQTIRQWRRLRQYMEDNSISSFNCNVGQEYLKYAYSGKTKSQLNSRQKNLYNSIVDLWIFLENGYMWRPNNSKRRAYVFDGNIGAYMCAYIDKMKADKLADNTVDIATRALNQLLQYLNSVGIEKIEDIYPYTMLSYIKTFTAQYQYKNSRTCQP